MTRDLRGSVGAVHESHESHEWSQVRLDTKSLWIRHVVARCLVAEFGERMAHPEVVEFASRLAHLSTIPMFTQTVVEQIRIMAQSHERLATIVARAVSCTLMYEASSKRAEEKEIATDADWHAWIETL
jgi:hypothetical protein